MCLGLRLAHFEVSIHPRLIGEGNFPLDIRLGRLPEFQSTPRLIGEGNNAL